VAHPSQQLATLYAVSGLGYGIYTRRDDETRWTAKNAGLSALAVADVVIDHPAGQALPTLYAGTTILDLFKGPNGGETWEATNFSAFGVLVLTNDPRYPSTLYALAGDGRSVRKSADGGATWENLEGLPYGILDLAVDPQTSDLYVGIPGGVFASSGGVYKRASNDTTWEPKNTGLPLSSSGNSIVSVYLIVITRPSPTVPATLYAATDSGLYKSTNGGDSWTLLNEQILPLVLISDPHAADTLYAIYSENRGNFGLYKSPDGGATWTFISSSPPGALGYVNTLAIDPNVPTTLYAGVSALGSTMFRSTDGGLHWTDISLNLNLPSALINSIVVDSRDSSSIYIGTGSGVQALQLANDLVVSKTGPASGANAPFTYTISVRNNGPFDATNVTVNDPLPTGLSLVSATPSQGTCEGTVTCQLGVLALNATATVIVVVQPTRGGVFTNTVTATAAEADLSPIDNTARATTTIDFDGDGYLPPDDCDDHNAAVHPGATEICDGLDNDCDGQIPANEADSDGDGVRVCSGDCNDANAAIHPGATEVCNGVDDNCNGQIDEGVQSTFYRDADGDGFGAAGSSTQACTSPSGYVTNNTDCNDTSVAIHPGATEICGDGIDQDCNGSDLACPPPPPLAVLTPNGGEVWPINSTQTIQWNPTGVSGNVKIELSRNGGTTWTVLFANTPNDGAQNWTVAGPATSQALVRISSLSNAAVKDSSNAVFTLGGGSVTVVAPNGGEVWPIGSTRSIQWTTSGFTGNVKIELSRTGGTTWTTLFGAVANTGAQNWVVTGPATTQARLRVSSVVDAGAVDTSDANLTLGGGSVTVVAPNGGEVWPIGSIQTLRWNSSGFTGNVKIELSRTGGTTWGVLFSNTANDGAENWQVTGPATTQARLRVSSVVDAGAVDTSDNGFNVQ
jgi:uncharacterized repeat protein (TIGR01451 family)